MAEFKLGRIRFVWKGAWASGQVYTKDDIVRYGGKTYVCVVGHSSAVDFYTDFDVSPTKWNQVSDGTTWESDWTTNKFYKENDIVKYGGIVYICKNGHTSASTTAAGLEANLPADWEVYAKSIVWLGNWAANTRYKANDVVKYGGQTYVCNTGHTSATTDAQGLEGLGKTTPGVQDDIGKWDLFSEGLNWISAGWTASTRYKINDVIRFGGQIYVCNTAHTSATFESPTWLGLENDQSKWDYLHKGFEFKGTWSASSVRYKANDIVKYGSALWICTTHHVSSAIFAEENWSQFVEGLEFENSWDDATVYQPGDIATYGGYAYVSKTNHTDQVPTSNSDDWDLFSTGFNFLGDWSDTTAYKVGDVIRLNGYTYVATADNTDQEPPSLSYWSRLNKGIAWQGDWETATEYKLGDAVKYGPSSYICITAHSSDSPSRPDNDVTGTYWNVLAAGAETSVLTTTGDLVYQGLAGPTRLPIGEDGQVLRVSDGVPDWGYWGLIDKVYYVAPTGTDDTVANGWGTTIDRPWQTVEYACSQVTGPATINIKTGVYSEVLPISIPAGVALVGDELRGTVIQPASGYETSDMFYMRNGTGLRNMTVQGLSGTLGSDNAYGTKRPTAGAYVSLDPGTGPDDTSVWITNKSPYVQNVTTFGTGCVGLKVDGALHDGGNDSIVANDFTQILSDGIGAWVTNLGRAELVSVFSYYGHIGYLAENGGKIRATNGNSSYGTFGCVSEGVDVNEVPITGKVDNRFGEAIVTNVLTNGNSIYQLEYLNAGINYTSGSVVLNGAGFNASAIVDEFRDNGVFEVRITDTGSGVGGTGYITAANVAQGGTTTAITLAATDSAISTAYVGMRIIITSGTGAGQSGYINSYNSGTKIAQIYKETTGTPGWDHVIPGVAIASALDLTTNYVIEPRLTFTAPGYAATNRTQIAPTGAWSDVVFGNTTAVFSAVAATGGDGSSATFNVSRNGNRYTVTQQAPGTGYSLGNALTIAGTSLGGAAPANNITITVTGVTTGAITDFTYTGVGIGGRFVAIAGGGSTSSMYSADGITWTSGGATSSSQNWIKLAYGTPSNQPTWIAVPSSSDVTTRSVNGGTTWSAGGVLPSSGAWTVAYGNGYFVAIRVGTSQTATAYTTDGTSWTTGGNRTSANWSCMAYGNGIWVALTNGSATGASSTNNGTTWTPRTIVPGAWSSVTYGNGKFVAVESGGTATMYSLDGITWVAGGALPNSAAWNKVEYGQGLFFAMNTANSSNAFASSEDGLNWTTRGPATTQIYGSIAFGNSEFTPRWIAIASTGTSAQSIVTGTTTKARAKVLDNKISEIRIVEPGSGYTSAPTMTIIDPNNTVEATTAVRTGVGVLANPTFTNRGTGYVAASATITGDGTIDIFQSGTFIYVENLTASPAPGSNIQFAGDSNYYKLVAVTQLLGSGLYTARLQVSPPITVTNAPAHGVATTFRIKYSQVRLTGHDFLEIGTGNAIDTNYPGTPANPPDPMKEIREGGGGRVFYTSTDQDGNFRVGTLFSVEQATGVATLNADAFNIAGLNELTLGAVALGGSGATITEFSTDAFFTADSDSIIPTQRAIKAYISSQIGGGGSSLNVNTLTAGQIFIANDTITTTTGAGIDINTKMNFTGGIDGTPVALNYFLLG